MLVNVGMDYEGWIFLKYTFDLLESTAVFTQRRAQRSSILLYCCYRLEYRSQFDFYVHMVEIYTVFSMYMFTHMILCSISQSIFISAGFSKSPLLHSEGRQSLSFQRKSI